MAAQLLGNAKTAANVLQQPFTHFVVRVEETFLEADANLHKVHALVGEKPPHALPDRRRGRR